MGFLKFIGIEIENDGIKKEKKVHQHKIKSIKKVEKIDIVSQQEIISDTSKSIKTKNIRQSPKNKKSNLINSRKRIIMATIVIFLGFTSTLIYFSYVNNNTTEVAKEEKKNNTITKKALDLLPSYFEAKKIDYFEVIESNK